MIYDADYRLQIILLLLIAEYLGIGLNFIAWHPSIFYFLFIIPLYYYIIYCLKLLDLRSTSFLLPKSPAVAGATALSAGATPSNLRGIHDSSPLRHT